MPPFAAPLIDCASVAGAATAISAAPRQTERLGRPYIGHGRLGLLPVLAYRWSMFTTVVIASVVVITACCPKVPAA